MADRRWAIATYVSPYYKTVRTGLADEAEARAELEKIKTAGTLQIDTGDIPPDVQVRVGVHLFPYDPLGDGKLSGIGPSDLSFALSGRSAADKTAVAMRLSTDEAVRQRISLRQHILQTISSCENADTRFERADRLARRILEEWYRETD